MSNQKPDKAFIHFTGMLIHINLYVSCLGSTMKRTTLLTEVISGRQVLVLTAGVPLLPVQQEVVDHLLLVLPEDRDAQIQG